MAMNNIGAGGVQGFHVTSMKRARSLRTPAENDYSVVNLAAVALVATDADSLPVTVGDTNSGEMVNPSASAASAHEIGKDPWWVVGFSLVAASDSSYILTYPFLIMSQLGWIAGPIVLVLLTALSCHNNCLFGSLHETGGKRHIRTRDLISYVYGRPWLTRTVWIVQFTVLIIFCIGTFIWAGTSLQAIYVTYSNDPTKISLPVWIAIAGACYSIFAFLVPTLHSLGLYTAISLLLTMTITFISIGISIKDGMKSGVTRDYSLVGTTADKWFGALASLSIVSFAFNIPILPELQANVRPPTVRNIYKALAFEYIVGATPVIVLVFLAYWAYGNGVSEYLLYSTSGPTWLVTVANVAAFLQVLVTIHIFALPMFEYFDSLVSKIKRRHAEGDVADDHTLRARTGEWSKHKMLLRFVTRTTFIGITTLLGAMFPFFGDILELGAALIVFPLNYGLVHHMYLTVNSKRISWYQRAWHWSIIVEAVVLTVSSVTASTRNIIISSSSFHIFKSSS
ncbi:unnamed protein product [Sphagnum jensenii]|uniref:Amino acid transporter transmembrane domain-containing protein n=1 Tax=Sphagnum jensenii TaxID=128206 RepID=A0ABP1B0B8_9BRYO